MRLDRNITDQVSASQSIMKGDAKSLPLHLVNHSYLEIHSTSHMLVHSHTNSPNFHQSPHPESTGSFLYKSLLKIDNEVM